MLAGPKKIESLFFIIRSSPNSLRTMSVSTTPTTSTTSTTSTTPPISAMQEFLYAICPAHMPLVGKDHPAAMSTHSGRSLSELWAAMSPAEQGDVQGRYRDRKCERKYACTIRVYKNMLYSVEYVTELSRAANMPVEAILNQLLEGLLSAKI